MATITVYLKYEIPKILWRNDESERWKEMGRDSATAKATAGDTIEWKVAADSGDHSIESIDRILVGIRDKINPGYQWKDIWKEKPSRKSATIFSGIISEDMRRGDADGYEISVILRNGNKVTVDPEIDVDDPPE